MLLRIRLKHIWGFSALPASAVCCTVLAYVQDLEPEVRTFNTAIIACNMCGQPQEALKVRQRLA